MGIAFYASAMAVDVVSNAFSYSLVGLDNRQPLLTGVGAVTRPGSTRLGEAPTSRSSATAVPAIGWYLSVDW